MVLKNYVPCLSCKKRLSYIHKDKIPYFFDFVLIYLPSWSIVVRSALSFDSFKKGKYILRNFLEEKWVNDLIWYFECSIITIPQVHFFSKTSNTNFSNVAFDSPYVDQQNYVKSGISLEI
jgi:hypothetical protein